MYLKKTDEIIHKYSAQVHCPQDFIVRKAPQFRSLAEF